MLTIEKLYWPRLRWVVDGEKSQALFSIGLDGTKKMRLQTRQKGEAVKQSWSRISSMSIQMFTDRPNKRNECLVD